MKGSAAALLFGLFVISVGIAWVLTGGPVLATDDVAVTPVLTPVTAAMLMSTVPTIEPEVTTASPVTPGTSLKVTTIVTTAPTVVRSLVSADQARDHFLAIAFSATNKLERLNYTEGQKPLIISLVAPDKTDAAFILGTVRDFNEASRTVKISEKIQEGGSGDIVIMFLPESGLSAVGGISEFMYGGKVVAKRSGYISGNLKGDVRNHTIARCIYYRLGVEGETTMYPDSLFYAGENTNPRLNTVDKKAIAILYGPGLSYGTTLEELRKVIYLP